MDHVLGSLASINELMEAAAPGLPAQQLRVLMQFSHNESLLAALGASKEVSTACSMSHAPKAFRHSVHTACLQDSTDMATSRSSVLTCFSYSRM